VSKLSNPSLKEQAMLLRRVIEHVREQNWVAVFIDFLIVVVGVFIGIQVANWNEERQLAAQEKSYLAQLRDEILGNHRMVDLRMRYNSEVVSAGERALAYLDGDGDCRSACAGLLVDFFHSSQVWGSSYLLSKYRELDRLGFPSRESVRGPVREYYLFLVDWNFINEFTPVYRETVRGHIRPEAFRALWGGCHAIIDSLREELLRGCEADLAKLDAAAMLRAMHADPALRQQLKFWLGQNILAEVAFPGMRQRGEAALAAVSGEFGPVAPAVGSR
jgi:hypothetical protein